MRRGPLSLGLQSEMGTIVGATGMSAGTGRSAGTVMSMSMGGGHGQEKDQAWLRTAGTVKPFSRE